MALEIERRFLVCGETWRAHAGCAQPLRQGYLAASAEGVTVRLRIKGDDQAWLTLKAPAGVSGLVRHEFEYVIPVDDAEAMWQLAPHRLEKTRWVLDLPGGEWVVDCFTGRMLLWCWRKWSCLTLIKPWKYQRGVVLRSPANLFGRMRC